MAQTTKQSLAAELETELPHFTGTENYTNMRYPWLHVPFLLTDGAKYLAEKAKAFWLIDAIASYQINKTVAGQPFQVWELVINADRKAVLTCMDGNKRLLVEQEIPYTDFPLDQISLYAAEDDCLGGRVVMLSSEY